MPEKRWWDVAMVTMALLLAIVTTLFDLPLGARQFTSLAVIALVLIAYFSWGRRHLDAEGSLAGLAYAGFLLVALGVGISLDRNFTLLQVMVFPSLWVFSRSLKQAVLLNALAIIPVTVGFTINLGPSGFLNGLGVGVLSIAFSMAIGLWITSFERAANERARLLNELLATQEQLAAVNHGAGVDSERARLAREIHDTIAQSLTGLVMVAQRAHGELEKIDGMDTDALTARALAQARSDVALIESMARDALTEARGLVAAITPVRVESTLAEALDRLAERFARETGVRVDTDLVGSRPLGAELEVVLLRCAQEALANVRKHAHAAVASITVTCTEDEVVLIVTDDGIGPAGADESQARTGLGLVGMTERLALVGGTLQLTPALPRGSRLSVAIPLGAVAARPSGLAAEVSA